ncbi:MAG TPA: aldo/keto reductase [Anaerolineales bacterium]|nr:aldo/keto reductase [Anaerolineales bacterium]
MQYRYLGRTGLKVSELCLGAMTFGRESTEEVSHQMLDCFVEAGGNFIDTANVYSHGISEEILGRWLKGKRRDDFIIATKVRFSMGSAPNDLGLSRKHILSAVEASLRRLNTSYIDLYQVHMWDPGTPLEETLEALNQLVQSGKVRYLGASNYAVYQLQKAIDLSRQWGWEPFSCLQPLYNLLDRSFEWELLPVCEAEGVGVIPWSPLRGGWLSGKYHRGMSAPPPDTRIEEAAKKGWSESWNVYANERTWQVIDTLLAIAEETQKTPAQVALNWLLQKPAITAPILGARTVAHLEDNLGATGWSLTIDQMDRLDRAGDLPLPYPYESLAQQRGQRGR